MGSRIDNNITPIGGGIYRDPNERVFIRVVKSEDDTPSGVPIKDNSINFLSLKGIIFHVNSKTTFDREVPILEGTLKLKMATRDPNSTTEEVCHESPITNGVNDIKFDFNDLKDTLVEILKILNDDGVLFP